MHIHTDLIAEGVYRICLFEPASFIAFNHFLIVDERPALIHLGSAQAFQHLYEAVSRLIDPASLAYLAFSHYEPDECGAMAQWLEVAPKAQVCVGKICAMSLGEVLPEPQQPALRVLKDGEILSLGREDLMMLETPHFPHNWDACLFYLKQAKILFGSDLATQPGYREPFVDADPTDEIMDLQRKMNYMPYGPAMAAGLGKLQALEINTLAAMHGAMLNQVQTQHFLETLAAENARYLSV